LADARNILITGGTDGIGAKLAQAYAKTGANVVITGRRGAKDIPESISNNLSYIMADQSTPEQAAEQIAQGLEKLGWQYCDLAILNAGIGKAGNPLDESGEELLNTINVNLTAPILIAHGLANLLSIADAGKLVFIGSTSHTGAANFASYAASKAGLNGFARSLRQEWLGKTGVQIIHPGPIATKMHAKAGFDPGIFRHLFLDPDFMTRAIMRKIERGNSPLSISFPARIWDYLTLRNWISR